jgi:hypothetical protein
MTPTGDPTQFYVYADEYGGANLTSLIGHPCQFHLPDGRVVGKVGQHQSWSEYHVSRNIQYLKGSTINTYRHGQYRPQTRAKVWA